MQVNSVSSTQSFKAMPLEARILSQLDDNQISQIAYGKASYDVNDKKHNRLNNMLYYSVPLAGALSYAVLPSKMSRIGRLGTFANKAAFFTLPFVMVDAAYALRNKIAKHSDSVDNFSHKHPVLSNILTATAGIVSALALHKGATNIIAKHSDKLLPKVTPIVENLSKKLNNSKVLNYVSKQINRTPSALRNFSKIVLDFSPYMILGTQIGHYINHERVKNQEYYKNYQTLKEAQYEIRKAAEE